MKRLTLLSFAVIAGAMLIISNLAVTSVFAVAEPKGIITLSVRNQTSKSKVQNANTTTDALKANPGDTVQYNIEIRNGSSKKSGAPLRNITVTAALPNELSFSGDPGKRTISETMSAVQPGNTITKIYALTVSKSAQQGSTIKNMACFTGNSQAKDSPQQGCDTALIAISDTAATLSITGPLPATGSSIVTASFFATATGILGYTVRLRYLKRGSSA